MSRNNATTTNIPAPAPRARRGRANPMDALDAFEDRQSALVASLPGAEGVCPDTGETMCGCSLCLTMIGLAAYNPDPLARTVLPLTDRMVHWTRRLARTVRAMIGGR